jgi:hypothetical protein
VTFGASGVLAGSTMVHGLVIGAALMFGSILSPRIVDRTGNETYGALIDLVAAGAMMMATIVQQHVSSGQPRRLRSWGPGSISGCARSIERAAEDPSVRQRARAIPCSSVRESSRMIYPGAAQDQAAEPGPSASV